MSEIRNVIVIGGGASGMASALFLAKKGLSVSILEHTKGIGKKLSVTGNGRCNYTNLYQVKECYRSKDIEKAFSIIEEFNGEKAVEFFETLGIIPNIKKGREFDNPLASYVYPLSFSGKDFVAALQEELLQLKIKIKTNTKVLNIKRRGDFFEIETGEKNNPYIYRANYVIIATGGLAMPSSGSDGSLNCLIQKLGHTMRKQLPALTSLSSKETLLRELSGLRIEGKITSFLKEGEIESQTGEIQFSDRGISGIPVMNLSGKIARELDEGKKVKIRIDFLPSFTKEGLFSFLCERREKLAEREGSKFFLGMFSDKFSRVIEKGLLEKNKKVKELTDIEIMKLVGKLKEFEFEVNSVGDFPFAQTTSGGVTLSEVTGNLESTKVEKLYFVGEVLDVDGLCGGYNLTWAWASAYRVSRDIGEIT